MLRADSGCFSSFCVCATCCCSRRAKSPYTTRTPTTTTTPRTATPTFLLMRAVGGGSGCSSNPEGDSIACFSSFMAALRLPQYLTSAELGALSPATCRCSPPPYESIPLSFDVFPTQEARLLGRRGDPQCTCCL